MGRAPAALASLRRAEDVWQRLGAPYEGARALDLAEHPPFANELLELVAREEDAYGPPYGRALDIGTGSAVWGVRLAERGWEVTGIDNVDKALRRARERVKEARVEMHLVQGDVTAMQEGASARAFGWCSTRAPSTASPTPSARP